MFHVFTMFMRTHIFFVLTKWKFVNYSLLLFLYSIRYKLAALFFIFAFISNKSFLRTSLIRLSYNYNKYKLPYYNLTVILNNEFAPKYTSPKPIYSVITLNLIKHPNYNARQQIYSK